jgi:NADH:ubiquinone oxidoreductase subunit 5 (subunit L)/multisubunit Na+/H+ antiporter MnhA subunit
MIYSFIVGLLVVGAFLASWQIGKVPWEIELPFGQWEPFLLDTLSLIMLSYIWILSFFILKYATKNFEREKLGRWWLFWFGFTILSVSFFVAAGDLILILISLMGISVGLHKLLLAFPDRKKSVQVAGKKFHISRIGDLSFLIALVILYQQYSTLNISDITQQFLIMDPSQRMEASFWPALFIAIACLVHSAQFPFHSWLPESIDTPTPVSALMHAGVINAGGFLLVRMQFLYEPFGAVAILILGFGIITTWVGGLSMLAQVDVKRKLAYSTIGQMGFMMVEFGLGLYPLVILHLMGHGFYKAYGFLSSGSREVVPTLALNGESYRSALAIPILLLPVALVLLGYNVEIGLVVLLALQILAVLPKEKSWLALILGFALVAGSAGLPLAGEYILGIESRHGLVPLPVSVIALISLSGLGVFTHLITYWNSEDWVKTLYCYANRGFLSNFFMNKEWNRLNQK